MRETLTFDDVLLVPQYSQIQSRSSISLEQDMPKAIKTALPIVSSPMDTVTESEMATSLSLAGGIGIVHRYNSIENQVKIVQDAVSQGAKNIGAAIGVSGDFEERAEELYDAGANILCIDIAHGHHTLMQQAIKAVRDVLGDSVHIMAGNVATLQAFEDLSEWGADSIRVGVGGGSICSTRVMTGHGLPTLQSVIDCAKSDSNALLIADGGIKQTGDIIKAIAAGADMVMLGSMLAGTDESPGETFYVDGVKCKSYRGMASAAAQIDWRGHVASEEGVSHRVTTKGPVNNILNSIEKALRSGMSYSGAANLSVFRAKADMVKITQASLVESRPHILQS
jgi:IMP dehydrogenase